MDDLASAFSGLPYFSHNMMINRSETCATRKLVQCTDFGVSMNDVTQKFYGHPDNAPDLTKEEFMARRLILDQVSFWCETHADLKYDAEWAPILYKYEIVKASAKRPRDWGHLLFTDMTLSRFLLVMIFPETCNCGNYSHHDYDALTKYQADRFMSLLVYLHGEWEWGNEPKWYGPLLTVLNSVRATYVTPTQDYALSPEFLDNMKQLAGDHRTPGQPPIFQVTREKFTPTLLPLELEKIDNTVARGNYSTKRKDGKPSVRDQVLGTKDDRPEVSKAWLEANARQCAYCEAPKEAKHLMLCSKCKLVYYCGRECQRMAWPSHKIVCRKAQTEAH